MQTLLKYGLGLLLLAVIYWLYVFSQDKEKAARMIGLDCWSDCSSSKTVFKMN